MRCFEAKASKSSEDEYSVMNWVMHRFRPIAPKPSVGDQQQFSDQYKRNDFLKTARRTKRRYVRVRGRQNKKSARDDGKRKSSGADKVTLQLLPTPAERSEDDNSFGIISFQKTLKNSSILFTNGDLNQTALESVSGNETLIIVESLMDSTCGVGLGFTDREKISNLEMDGCPGFVSDCTNKVVWVNEACRKMIQNGEDTVRLVVKEKLPHYCPLFACRARLLQQCPKRSITVACDVWRMEFAGFAWKLDVTTALCLTSFQ